MESILKRFPQLESLSSAEIAEKLETLPPRQRNTVLGGIIFVIALVCFLSIRAGMEKANRLSARLKTTQNSLAQIKHLTHELDERNRQSSALRSRIRPSSGFYLSTFLENEAARYRTTLDTLSPETRQDLGENIEEVSSDVKIATIPFKAMLNFMSDLENSPNALLRIKRIRVKTLPGDLVNVELSFKISAYLLKS